MANVAIDHRVGGKVGGRTWTLEQRHCWGLWSPAIIVISLISIGVIINIVISSIVILISHISYPTNHKSTKAVMCNTAK